MDVGLHGWGCTPGTPGHCTKRYTVHERAFVFQVNFILVLFSVYVSFLFFLFVFLLGDMTLVTYLRKSFSIREDDSRAASF